MRIFRVMMFRWMWVGSFNLYKAFRANWLLTAAGGVEIRWIIQKADRAFRGIFVEDGLQTLAVYIRIFG